MKHLPNLICLARILLIWPIVTALDHEEYRQALALFFVAAASDGLDGYLAKRYRWTSQLGKFLDPLADKLLLVTVFIAATWLGIVPWWLTAAAVGRDVMIGLGALMYRTLFGPLKGRPTVLSKINTLLQISYLVAAMLRAAFGFPPTPLLDALAAVAFVSTLLSGFDYLQQFTRRAWTPNVARDS